MGDFYFDGIMGSTFDELTYKYNGANAYAITSISIGKARGGSTDAKITFTVSPTSNIQAVQEVLRKANLVLPILGNRISIATSKLLLKSDLEAALNALKEANLIDHDFANSIPSPEVPNEQQQAPFKWTTPALIGYDVINGVSTPYYVGSDIPYPNHYTTLTRIPTENNDLPIFDIVDINSIIKTLNKLRAEEEQKYEQGNISR